MTEREKKSILDYLDGASDGLNQGFKDGYNQALEDIFNHAKQNAYDDGVDYSLSLQKLDELITKLTK